MLFKCLISPLRTHVVLNVAHLALLENNVMHNNQLNNKYKAFYGITKNRFSELSVF